jgi:hypothetical protein
MKRLFQQTLAIAALAALTTLSLSAQAAQRVDYVYNPADGVHEVKHFHGCFDGNDVEARTKVYVTMSGLSTDDVTIETKPHEINKPSSEMITFRLKHRNASFSVQFRSHDGPHCQQGVQSVAFSNKVLHNAAQAEALR